MRTVSLGVTLGVLLTSFASYAAAPAGAAQTQPRCRGEVATIVGTATGDTLVGTSGRDVIVGLGGDDAVFGRGGADLICGGLGSDRLNGNRGDDRLYGEQDRLGPKYGITLLVGDKLSGGPGDDWLYLGRDDREEAPLKLRDVVTYRHSKVPVSVVMRRDRMVVTGEGNDHIYGVKSSIIGSRFDDNFRGSPGRDLVVGGGGNDVADLRGGSDGFDDAGSGPTYVTAEGSVLIGVSKEQGRRQEVVQDLIAESRGWRGGEVDTGDDLVRGGRGRDFIWSASGADEFHGDAGHDLLIGFADNAPAFDGGTGDDELLQTIGGTGGSAVGGAGEDSLYLHRSDHPKVRKLAPTAEIPQVVADISAGLVTTGWASGAVTTTVDAFETFGIDDNVSLTYYGGDLVDRVVGPRFHSARIYLGGGDDLAMGGNHPDHFDGGDGFDEVEVGQGDTTESVEKVQIEPLTDLLKIKPFGR